MLGRPGRGALSPPPARAAGRAGPLPEARTRGGPVSVWKNNPTKLTTPHRMSETMDSRIHERFELTLPSPFTYGMLAAAATAVEGGAHSSTKDSRSRSDANQVVGGSRHSTHSLCEVLATLGGGAKVVWVDLSIRSAACASCCSPGLRDWAAGRDRQGRQQDELGATRRRATRPETNANLRQDADWQDD